MLRGQPVGGDLNTLCSLSPRRKNIRLDVYCPPNLYGRLVRIAEEYGVSVQRVLLLSATLADEKVVRDVLECQRLGLFSDSG